MLILSISVVESSLAVFFHLAYWNFKSAIYLNILAGPFWTSLFSNYLPHIQDNSLGTGYLLKVSKLMDLWLFSFVLVEYSVA